jgi:hypothetical protein
MSTAAASGTLLVLVFMTAASFLERQACHILPRRDVRSAAADRRTLCAA